MVLFPQVAHTYQISVIRKCTSFEYSQMSLILRVQYFETLKRCEHDIICHLLETTSVLTLTPYIPMLTVVFVRVDALLPVKNHLSPYLLNRHDHNVRV